MPHLLRPNLGWSP